MPYYWKFPKDGKGDENEDDYILQNNQADGKVMVHVPALVKKSC